MKQICFCGTIILFLSIALLIGAETFQCKQRVEAFDPSDSTRFLGYFEPGSSLEIGEFVASSKMYRVRYKESNGTEIQALCRSMDLGKEPPKTEKPATAPTAKNSASASKDSLQPPIFQSILQIEPSLWETPSSNFALKQSQYGFRWVSLTENNVSRSPVKLKFLNQPVYETIARFKNDKLDEISLLLFGRGDAEKELSEIQFEEIKKQTELSLDDVMGSEGAVDKTLKGNASGTERKSWIKVPVRADLEWSVTRNATEETIRGDVTKRKYRAEFLRLVFSPYDGKKTLADLTTPNYQSAPKVETVKRGVLKERVKQEPNGDVYLEGMPMVDQGAKGYCVVAATERIMRYYGLDIDQNELAKVTNSTDRGTSTESMLKALKRFGSPPFSLVVREGKGLEAKDVIKDIDNYNRLAKREKKPVIEYGMRINLAQIYQSMDPAIFRQAKLKDAGDRSKFLATVSDHIDKGAPLLWTVILGLIAEKPALPQAFGGHMRLVIGYNKKNSEVIYTDTWGAGHEFKRMAMDDAFIITCGWYSVLPSS